MSTALHGLLAEFASAEALRRAAHAARSAGYRHLDAYTPYPVEGMTEALGLRRTRLPLLVLLGGLAGAAGAYGLQWYSAVYDYPLQVGGRPLHSWPAFVPITFELMVLFAALCAVFGMLWRNGFPRLYHPVFHVPEFKRASQESFFLCLEAEDPFFQLEGARRLLAGQHPLAIWEVPK